MSIHASPLLRQFLGNIQDAKSRLQKTKGVLSSVAMERQNMLDLNLVVGVDCSGSISQEMFSDFMAQVHKIRGMSRIKVVEVSDKIEAVYDIDRPRSKVVHLRGGGGNGENIFFPFAKKMKPDAILYMTDGYCTPAENPKIPTAWILTKKGIKPYGWGEVVHHLSH